MFLYAQDCWISLALSDDSISSNTDQSCSLGKETVVYNPEVEPGLSSPPHRCEV